MIEEHLAHGKHLITVRDRCDAFWTLHQEWNHKGMFIEE